MLLVDDLAAGGTKNLRHTPRGLVTLMKIHCQILIPIVINYSKSDHKIIEISNEKTLAKFCSKNNEQFSASGYC